MFQTISDMGDAANCNNDLCLPHIKNEVFPLSNQPYYGTWDYLDHKKCTGKYLYKYLYPITPHTDACASIGYKRTFDIKFSGRLHF